MCILSAMAQLRKVDRLKTVGGGFCVDENSSPGATPSPGSARADSTRQVNSSTGRLTNPAITVH